MTALLDTAEKVIADFDASLVHAGINAASVQYEHSAALLNIGSASDVWCDTSANSQGTHKQGVLYNLAAFVTFIARVQGCVTSTALTVSPQLCTSQ